ncbi:somatoliberin [Acomys russatus]|uniref:somatoliberin n=1 Tax=Acomys russatus TaxID=60746 RepID=UPI0021E33B31|nr:somatoliberin [Acomys russatus]
MPLWVFFVILTLISGSHCSVPPSLPIRMRRHIDAIFTTHYRKLLAKQYARKMLQDIMNRQQGERNEGQGTRVSRQVSMQENDKWMSLDSILVGFLRMKSSAEA